MAYDKSNHSWPRVFARGHRQEITMDILYILKCVAYIASIPALAAMARLFYLEGKLRQEQWDKVKDLPRF